MNSALDRRDGLRSLSQQGYEFLASRIHLIGAGGHAKVVIDIFKSRDRAVMDLYDDDDAKHGSLINGVRVEGPISATSSFSRNDPAHLAIGSNAERARLAGLLAFHWIPAIHATAWISDSATIEEGAMLGAFAVVQADARVAAHAIINTGAIVEHDVSVGEFAHIAPGVKLGGGASVGAGSLIGLGACLLPNMKVGKWCRIGAGAVVTSDVADNCTVVGVPGRVR